jgi:hypothetical protein
MIYVKIIDNNFKEHIHAVMNLDSVLIDEDCSGQFKSCVDIEKDLRDNFESIHREAESLKIENQLLRGELTSLKELLANHSEAVDAIL